MRTFIGIDLGSTTTKAVLLDENQDVIGRGITNSRSNYGTAARVASEEARIDGRFTLFRRALSSGEANGERVQEFLGALETKFSPRSIPRAAERSRRNLHRAIADRKVRESGGENGRGAD